MAKRRSILAGAVLGGLQGLGQGVNTYLRDEQDKREEQRLRDRQAQAALLPLTLSMATDVQGGKIPFSALEALLKNPNAPKGFDPEPWRATPSTVLAGPRRRLAEAQTPEAVPDVNSLLADITDPYYLVQAIQSLPQERAQRAARLESGLEATAARNRGFMIEDERARGGVQEELAKKYFPSQLPRKIEETLAVQDATAQANAPYEAARAARDFANQQSLQQAGQDFQAGLAEQGRTFQADQFEKQTTTIPNFKLTTGFVDEQRRYSPEGSVGTASFTRDGRLVGFVPGESGVLNRPADPIDDLLRKLGVGGSGPGLSGGLPSGQTPQLDPALLQQLRQELEDLRRRDQEP